MTFQNIYVPSNYIAFNCTAHGGSTGQGAGSLSILDSHFNCVPYAITVSAEGPQPNLNLDNLLVEDSDAIVLVDGGETIFPGSSGQITVEPWGMGGAYLNGGGDRQVLSGYIDPTPTKPQILLDDNGRYFDQPKPLYTSSAGGSIIVATAHGVSNDMTGDQSSAINSLLAGNIGSVIFFPAGIYLVKNTVFVPKGSIIVGEGWSQIMASGSYFENVASPKVMVWFWGSSSEHSELYNYEMASASDIFLSHMQTETPYYQPEQYSQLLAYTPGVGNFTSDPTFSDCSASNCISSWALRVFNSSNIFIYSMGFYSFFDNFQLGCGNQQDCQERIVQTDYSGDLYLYNIFTYGSEEIVSPAGGFPEPVFFNDSNQSGYTSEVAAWLELASGDGSQYGDGGSGSSGVGSGVLGDLHGNVDIKPSTVFILNGTKVKQFEITVLVNP
ncbi:hypothetical protein MBLNU459_g7631t2 [Dothideomycetes sp. NU459]